MIVNQPNAKNYAKKGFIDTQRMVKILETERN